MPSKSQRIATYLLFLFCGFVAGYVFVVATRSLADSVTNTVISECVPSDA